MTGYGDYGSSLRDLPRLRHTRRRRVSSWDRSGGNEDRIWLRPGQTEVIADIPGAGNVNHIWMTTRTMTLPYMNPAHPEPDFLRRLVLRAFWDGEQHPSVEVPLGDFFGVGHGRYAQFNSVPLQCSPREGISYNSFFHMPFAEGARFEITSECRQETVPFYWYIDYEEFDELEEGLGRFHAQWRRENPCDGVPQGAASTPEHLLTGTNLDGEGNYTILDARGYGHYVGCVLNVHNLRQSTEWNWYGEGDDMIFIDGERWPPSLHGTGTEDYFNTAWCPDEPFSAPYHGITLAGGPNWSGQTSLYRFHIEDPVTFAESIRVTIEHGHANKRSDDYSSVAYWYQAEPHVPFRLPPLEQRLPRPL
ncbi:glycoside hydrolase family 172 protein [Sciscionella marina]|uniref:glycoside hydrolase family 172 protein n=1 Tax=Sciscionella marina TaxID=508770 RepID=UPI00037BE8F9|nr:glycoside hydrolase family 172 protein [Sciscionella marina]